VIYEKRNAMSLIKQLKILVRTKFAKSEYNLHGIKLPIDRSIITDRILYSIMRGHYESTEAEALRKFVLPRDNILELGGGIGLISSLAAKVAHEGKVICVEANPHLIPYIQKVHQANGVKPTVINAIAAGNSAKTEATFYLRKNFWVSSMSPEPRDYVDQVQVPLASITKLVTDHKPTVVIIDIEGGEMDLIDSDWTHGVRLVMMEIHPDVTGDASTLKLTSFFEKLGFAVSIESKILVAKRELN
jgi:FkbM family methyltransferase